MDGTINGTIIWSAVVVVAAIVAWILGGSLSKGRYRSSTERLLEALRRGDGVSKAEGEGAAPQPVRDLRAELADNWVQRGSERDDAIREVLTRLGGYLKGSMARPLSDGLKQGGPALKDCAEAALEAVEDLSFFLNDPPQMSDPESHNLAHQVQDVTREYTQGSEAMIKFRGPPTAIHARMHRDAFKDALYLILHNAAEFGGGKPIIVQVGDSGSRAIVIVRDQGPGFSAEALTRAYDPFYSTAPGGLGLGLPHARRLITAMGGEILLRNCDKGGAEVEILLQE